MAMTDEEKDDLVRYLTTQNTHRKQWINCFIRRPRGSFGRPVLTAQDLRDARRQARIRKERGELVTVATQPWDRREDETPRAYEAFVIYRDLGSERSMSEAMRILGKGPSIARTWARQFQWTQRVRAYDEYEEKRTRKITERAKKEMIERQARLGQKMTEIAQSSLDAGAIVPESVADVVRLAEAGTRIERLARGESTENVAGVTKLILAHPLPIWAPDQAKQLVEESVYGNEYENDESEGSTGSQTPNGNAGTTDER